MNAPCVLLWLEGPLQAWGHNSRFWNRDTLPFPAKSGIYGLLLSAMGKSGEQEEFLAELAPCEQEVISYTAEKIDFRLILEDFQTVGTGYDEKDKNWEKFHIPKTSEGKSAVGGGSKLTHRYYIQDGKFAVIQDIPAKYIDAVKQALEKPIFDTFLGRKNCPPSDFVFRGTFSTRDEARKEAGTIASDKKLREEFRVREGEYQNDGEVRVLNDIPLQFGSWKKYRDRVVTVINSE